MYKNNSTHKRKWVETSCYERPKKNPDSQRTKHKTTDANGADPQNDKKKTHLSRKIR